MNKQYLIEDIRVDNNTIRVKANEKFKNQYLTDEDFWVEYDPDVRVNDLDYSVITIPFILNVIPILWLSGDEYYIKCIDKTFADSLEDVRQSFQKLYPRITWKGKLIADNVTEISNTPIRDRTSPQSDIEESVGMFFSGGVDSFFTLYNNFQKIQILITICGNDIGINNIEGWLNLKNKYSDFSERYGYSNAFIRSNLRSFLKHQYLSSLYLDIPIWWINIQNSLAYVGCSAPVLVSKGCKKLLVPSSYTEDYKTSSGFRPEIDNKITWKNFRVEQDGYEYSRQEKIKLIKDICETKKIDKPELRVCTHLANSKNLTNCCKCEKCLRTMIGVLVEGDNIRDYGFNLSIIKTIERIKDELSYSSMITKEDQLFFWQDIQSRVKEIISEDDSCVIDGVNLKPFLSWLISVDLRKFYITHQRVNRFRQLVKVLSSRFPIVFRFLYQIDKLFK